MRHFLIVLVTTGLTACGGSVVGIGKDVVGRKTPKDSLDLSILDTNEWRRTMDTVLREADKDMTDTAAAKKAAGRMSITYRQLTDSLQRADDILMAK